MNSIVFCEIMGKKYPMVFSLGVVQILVKKLGGYKNLNKARSNITGIIEHLGEFTAEMIKYGEKYCDYVDAEKPKNAAVDEKGNWLTVTEDFIKTCASGSDMEPLINAVVQCLTQNQTIETKAKESKNA